MVAPFRFAVQGGPLDDAAALGEFARHVEALGYEELYSFDHMGEVDPFAPLIVAALASDSLRVGPLVLNNEFHQPVLLARTAATVDRLTNGRLILGLGTGYAQDEHDAIGLVLRPPGTRVTRLEESVVVLRGLLDTGNMAFTGEHHHVDLADLGLMPAQDHVPILIGGHGRRVVEIGARHADIFQFTGLTHGIDGSPSGGGFPLEAVAERARWLTDGSGDRVIERSTLVQHTDIGPNVRPPDGDRFGHSDGVIADTPFVLVGSVEQVVDKLERLREQLGISHVLVRDPDGFAPIVDALRGR
jgi:probable F420-dependent oxidoreductase